MNITLRVPGGIPLMTIVYKYNSNKVTVFIGTEGSGSTSLGDTCLSRFPDIYYNASVRPVVCPQLLGRYLNACNEIHIHNRMRQYNTALDKYWVTRSGYFRLSTTVELVMGITYWKLLFCHGISEKLWARNFQPESTTTGCLMTD